MLTLLTDRRNRQCNGTTRRDFLRVGALGGMTLPWLLRQQARAAGADARAALSGKSVIFLFLSGGPSQYETFDPKMEAPEKVRSATGEVKTTIPGVTFGGTMDGLAGIADKMAVVRSFRTRNTDHTAAAVLRVDRTVDDPRSIRNGPSWGSQYSHIAGALNEQTGFPNYALITPEAFDPKRKRVGFGGVVAGSAPGRLGPAFAPFDLAGGSALQKDMTLKISGEKLEDRRHLLAQMDRVNRSIDYAERMKSLDEYQAQAFDVLRRGAARALDLSLERPETVERYDTSRYRFGKDVIKSRHLWSPHTLGKQLLMARRLCEAGCGFVTIDCGGWDMHGFPNGNQFGIKDGMAAVSPAFNKAVTAFVEDVEARGLSDQVLLVITGEMGRSTSIDKNGGRNHYGKITPLALVGGGLEMGQVIGRSDRYGGSPADEPIEVANLFSTILHVLFDVPKLRTLVGGVNELLRTIDNEPPIAGL